LWWRATVGVVGLCLAGRLLGADFAADVGFETAAGLRLDWGAAFWFAVRVCLAAAEAGPW
jgi:hypothetical protein